MKFASWTCGNDGPDWGLVVRERLWSVPRLLSWAMRQGHPAVAGHGSSTLVEFLHAGGSPSGLAFLEVLFPQLPESDLDGQPFCVPLDGAALLPPVLHPPAFRDFYAFEQHVKSARARRGLDMIPEWYDFPVFYFSNPHSLIGHGAPVERPRATRELDFELEIAAVLGRGGRDLSPEQGLEAILGFTVLNDWSARDLQREEMKVGLGPAKGKDFATSLGPWIVTPDELADRSDGMGRWDLTMTARINGLEVSRGNFRDLHHPFGALIARASAGVYLYPGEVIGSGTVGTGCILELGSDRVPWLEPGDLVELEIERIGKLANRVAEPPPHA